MSASGTVILQRFWGSKAVGSVVDVLRHWTPPTQRMLDVTLAGVA